MEDEVDWDQGGDIVISSSSYEAHQAEVVTLKEVHGHNIRIHEHLLHRHIGKEFFFPFFFESFIWKY